MTAKIRADLLTEAEANLADNTTEQISPQDLRDMIKNVIDSVFNILGDNAAAIIYNDGLAGSPTLYPTVHDALRDIIAGTVHALLAGRQTLTGGFAIAPYSIGTLGTGSPNDFTPAPADGNQQYYTNAGAHEIKPPASDCAIDLLVINGAGAGTITFSDFLVGSSTGDTYATTNGFRFLIQIRRVNALATYHIKALQ